MYSSTWIIHEVEYYGQILRYEVCAADTYNPSLTYNYPNTPEGLNRARERRDAMNGNLRVVRRVIE